jgi:thymidylate synthase
LLTHVTEEAEPGLDDRGPVLEAPPLSFEIVNLSWEDPLLSGVAEATTIARYERKFTSQEIITPFKYSYGARLRRLQGVDQVDWACELLRARPWSKSAWISLTVPGERPDAVPCLAALSVRVRRGELQMSAIFRSQNAFTAYLNYFPLRAIQAEISVRLGAPCGPLRVYVDVPHVYVADTERITGILSRLGSAGGGSQAADMALRGRCQCGGHRLLLGEPVRRAPGRGRDSESILDRCRSERAG